MTDENTNNEASTGLDTTSKTQAIIEAARRRNRNAEQADLEKAEGDKARNDVNQERVQELAEGRQEVADTNIQSRNKTIAGAIDPLAMGDVKGDGRDAKDYADSDPDKRFGVTTAEVGLNMSRDGADGEIATAFGHRVSKRTLAELNRGKENLEAAETERQTRVGQQARRQQPVEDTDTGAGTSQSARSAFTGSSTAVTDPEDDPDGKTGEELAAEKSGKPKLEDMTKAELVAYGAENGVELDGTKNKPELLADAKAINTDK